MSYTELPPGPLPKACTECGWAMQRFTTEMLPLDPQTGRGQLWEVIACPLHQKGNWGVKHHYGWWRDWYHDAFMIRPVERPASGSATEAKMPWWGWVLVSIFLLWLVLVMLVGLAVEVSR